MLQFQTLDDILDFAIVQEEAAQKFYAKLSDETDDLNMQLRYRTLVEEEQVHEKKLRKLKSRNSDLPIPDLTDLKKSGYLDALPISPDMSIKEVLLYALKKEKSAKMLYSTMAENMQQEEMAELFKVYIHYLCGYGNYKITVRAFNRFASFIKWLL